MKKLEQSFFTQPAYKVAQELIGKWICRQHQDGIEKFQIAETECYVGTDDTACHASKGKTPRTAVMWQPGGVCYVYLCYGIHHLLNFVTGAEGCPEGVLIRGVVGAIGPGRATKVLQIDKSYYGESLIEGSKIWVEDDGKPYFFKADKRVGIGYASQEDQDKLWRFILTQDA